LPLSKSGLTTTPFSGVKSAAGVAAVSDVAVNVADASDVAVSVGRIGVA
jgi:hypothetical protein